MVFSIFTCYRGLALCTKNCLFIFIMKHVHNYILVIQSNEPFHPRSMGF